MAREVVFQILPLVQVMEDHSPINISIIKQITAGGLEDEPSEDRLLSCLILSRRLPPAPEKWAEHRTHLIGEYDSFIKLFAITDYDQKILPNTTSWSEFGLQNDHLMELIHCDMARTGHRLLSLRDGDRERGDPEDPLLVFHVHMRRMERILYVLPA
jgi:hypothetical protein